MTPDEKRVEARKLYEQAAQATDSDVKAELEAQADSLIDEAQEEALYDSEREPTMDEIVTFEDDDFEIEDDDIEFIPDPNLLTALIAAPIVLDIISSLPGFVGALS